MISASGPFLQDWSENARRHGESAKECEERAAEWESIRPLLALAPQLLVLLDEAETFWGGDLTGDDPIDGGDLVECFAEWLPQSPIGLATIPAQSELSTARTLRRKRP